MIYMTDSNSNLIPFAMDNQGNIGEGLVALDTKVLWENTSPSSSFAAQTINVSDMSEYDYLLFNFKGASDVEWGFSQLVKKELGHRLFYGDSAGQRVCIRNFTINSSTSITFEAAISNSASLTSELIPLQIIGIKLVNSYAETNKYSLDEVKVGTWIDGKPIYRKVVDNITTASNNNWNTIYTDGNIKNLITIKGFLTAVDGRVIPINFSEDNAQATISFLSPNVELKLQYTGWYSRPLYIILEYTKTTD